MSIINFNTNSKVTYLGYTEFTTEPILTIDRNSNSGKDLESQILNKFGCPIVDNETTFIIRGENSRNYLYVTFSDNDISIRPGSHQNLDLI